MPPKLGNTSVTDLKQISPAKTAKWTVTGRFARTQDFKKSYPHLERCVWLRVGTTAFCSPDHVHSSLSSASSVLIQWIEYKTLLWVYLHLVGTVHSCQLTCFKWSFVLAYSHCKQVGRRLRWLFREISFNQQKKNRSDSKKGLSTTLAHSLCVLSSLFSVFVIYLAFMFTSLITWMSGCSLRHSGDMSNGPWRQQQLTADWRGCLSHRKWPRLEATGFYFKLVFWELSQCETKTWKLSHVGNNEIFVVRRKPSASEGWLLLNASWRESVETSQFVYTLMCDMSP